MTSLASVNAHNVYHQFASRPNNPFSAIESIIHRLGSIAALFKSFCCSFPIVHFWFIQNLAIGIMTSSYSTRRSQEQGCGADNNTFLSLRDLASVLSADLSISVIPQDKYEPKLPGRQENKFVTAHLKTEIGSGLMRQSTNTIEDDELSSTSSMKTSSTFYSMKFHGNTKQLKDYR